MRRFLTKQRMMAALIILIPWALAAGVVIGWIPVPGMGSAEAASETLSLSFPDSNVVRVGDTFEVDVDLSGAVNLGGFEFDLGYDPNVVQVDHVYMGNGLDAQDRTVGQLGPRDVHASTVAFGGYSYGSGAGSNGGLMAHVIMTAVGEGTSSLTLQNAHTADTAAQPMTPTLSSGSVTAIAASGGSQHVLQLRAGWNLITLPALPSDIAASSVFSQLEQSGKLVTVQSFECGSGGGALAYYPGLGSQNTLQKVLARRGYWVKVSADVTLSITGPALANGPIPLCKGWNLIAYTGPDTTPQGTPLDTALSSIAGKYTAVLGYDGGALSWYAELPASMNTLTTLQTGHGYWIYMTEDALLRYQFNR
jgi:hypothetical protein